VSAVVSQLGGWHEPYRSGLSHDPSINPLANQKVTTTKHS
jgi:hypothetical protein